MVQKYRRNFYRSLPCEIKRVLCVSQDYLLSHGVNPFFGILEQRKASRNHADNSFLECAVFARADYLVTRDKDLLVLHPFASLKGRPFLGISIVTPEDFIEELVRLGKAASSINGKPINMVENKTKGTISTK